MEYLQEFIRSPLFKAALLSGVGGFAESYRADRAALKAYINSTDPAATFHWKVAIRRWLIGFGVGFTTVLLPAGGAELLF